MDISRTVAEVQAFSATWTPPAGVLGRIIYETSRRVDAARVIRADLEDRARKSSSPPEFVAAMRGPCVQIIAEVKRRSPSRGEINAHLVPASRARTYADAGAAAISVLTEPAHFGGSEKDLIDVRAAVSVPVLRKDFVIDEIQIIEARAWGASALLLIARALAPAQLEQLASVAREWSLEPLVEIRSERELEAAMRAGARVLGINSRDLETLEVDATVVERLLPHVPSDTIAVAESGMTSRADVERAARAGADAVLIGSALSASADPATLMRELASVPRAGR